MTAIPSPPSLRLASRSPSQALKLIKVDYEVLPHVIDPVEAMQPDAPILHPHVRTKGIKGADKPSNVIERLDLSMGDVDKGFAEADVIVEHEYDTKPMHQGYIEPQSCVATCTEDGQVELWCCTQAPWVYRDRLTEILKIDQAKIRVTQSEMGGGFGGKTGFYARAGSDPARAQGEAAGEDHAVRATKCFAPPARFPAPIRASRWA